MADPRPDPDTGVEPDRRPTTGTPRWVTGFGIVALILVVVFVVLQLVGVGGRHGPGRHAPGGDTSTNAPSSGITTGGHTGPPPGVTHP